MLKQRIKKALSCVLAIATISTSLGVTALAAEDNVIINTTVNSMIWKKVRPNNYTSEQSGSEYTYYKITRNSATEGTAMLSVSYPYDSSTKTTGGLNLTGVVEIEARMKFRQEALTGMSKTDYVTVPIGIFDCDASTGANQNFPVRTLYIYNGKLLAANPARDSQWAPNATTVLESMTPDVFYTFKMRFNIDGDSTTTDTYIYSVYDTDGKLLAESTDMSNVGISGAGRAKDHYDMTKIDSIFFGGAKAGSATITYDTIKVTQFSAPEFTSTLADGTTEVKEGSKVTLTFDKEMNTSTFANIALQKADGTAVSGLTYTVVDNKNCVLTLPEILDSEAAYKIVVPSTVTATDGMCVVDEEISFTSAESSMIFYKDFSGITKQETSALYNNNDNAGFRRNNGGFGDGAIEGGLKFNIYANTNPHAFTYHTDRAMGVTGNIVLEAKMKFKEAGNNKTYYPLAILPENGIGHNNVLFAYPSNILKISGGKCYSGGKEICDITADTFYNFKVVLNIDGDSTTTDTFYTEISTDTSSLGTGSGNLTSTHGTVSGYPSLSAMTSLGGVHVVIANNVNAVATDVIIASTKGYYATIPEVTSSLVNGTNGVKAGDVVTLTFSEAMNTSTFANIALQTSDGTAVKGLKYEASDDGKTCVLTIPGYLKSEANYKLIIPSKVLSEGMIGVVEQVINFKSEKHSIIFYKDFDAMDTMADMTNDAEVKANFIDYAVDANANIVFTRTRTDSIISAVKYHKTAKLNLTGNLEFETKIKFDENAVAGTTTYSILPITIMDSNTVSNSNYGFPILLYIRDGKLYAANPTNTTGIAPNGVEICAIDTSKFYTFTIRMNVDGDSTTVDKYTYTVSDGMNTYSNTDGYSIGASGSDTKFNLYNLTSITDVYFGATKAQNAGYIIDYAKITQLTAPEFDVNTIDISVSEPIVITFTDDMNAAGFANITLAKEDGTPVDIIVTPVSGISDTCTITVEGGLDYGSAYILTVPAIISTSGLATEMAVIPVITEAMPDETISAVVESGTITAGKTLNVSTIFTNELKLAQTVTVVTAFYNAANELQGVVSEQNITIGGNGTYTHNAEFVVPSDIGDGAYVKVMAMDSFSTMKPIMTSIIK